MAQMTPKHVAAHMELFGNYVLNRSRSGGLLLQVFSGGGGFVVNVMRCLGFVCGRGPCWQQ